MAYITLAVSNNIKLIANKICVCLEPDPGINYTNYDAFSVKCIGIKNEVNENIIKAIPDKEYFVYGSEVKNWLSDLVSNWKNNPEQLYTFIKDISNLKVLAT